MNVHGRVTTSYIIFECKIPILDSENYQVYRIIPVPTPYQEQFTFIAPSSNYIITNLGRDKYYPMQQSEFDKCIPVDEDLHYCSKLHPLHNLQSDTSQCEINLLNHNKKIEGKCEVVRMKPRKVWILLRDLNSWLYVMDKETTFNLVCRGEASSITLINDGILTLEPGGQLCLDTMVITAQASYTSFTPQLNLSTIIPKLTSEPVAHHSSILNVFHYPDEQVRNLEHSIKQLKQAENSRPDISYSTHHIIHYSSYTILIIILIIIAFVRRHQQTHKPIQLPIPTPRTSV